MASTTAASSFQDLLATSLAAYGYNVWELLQKYTNYSFGKIMNEKKIAEQGGSQIIRNVSYKDTGASAMVARYQAISPNQVDTQVQVTMPWRYSTTYMNYELNEIKQNQGKAQIIALIDTKRQAMMADQANLFETQMWTLPGVSDTLSFAGIPNFLVPITGAQVTAGTSGFQGMNPAGYSATAGLDASSSTYDRWRNYNDVISASGFTTDDMKKMRTAWNKLHFMAPLGVPNVKDTQLSNFSLFTNFTRLAQIEEVAQDQNDSIGLDVGYAAGKALFRGLPIDPLDVLDTDTTNPIYGVNFDNLHFVHLDGEFMVESAPIMDRYQHLVYTVFCDTTGNLICTNRKKAGFVLSSVAAA